MHNRRDAAPSRAAAPAARARTDRPPIGSRCSKKELWLTEVAAGYSDASDIVPFVKQLMSTSGGLADRAAYPYVSRVSWFSEWSFRAFTVSGVAPRPNEAWQSSLFEPYGGLAPVGEAFFENCASVA